MPPFNGVGGTRQASNNTIVDIPQGMRKTWCNSNARSYLSNIIALEVLEYWLLSVPVMLAQSFECSDDTIYWTNPKAEIIRMLIRKVLSL